MKKVLKCMSCLLLIAGIVGFMGCSQSTTPEKNETTNETETPGGKTGSQDGTETLPGMTAKPVKVDSKTIGDQEFDIVEFGVWPQTVRAESIKIDENTTKNINGWECYKGSDNCYYVKVKATPGHPSEYPNPTFDNGSEIKEGDEYYFKIEPIKWRVLTDTYEEPNGEGGYKRTNKKLLFAERILLDHRYNNSTGTKYDTSEMRAYLNGYDGTEYKEKIEDFTNKGFINYAFTTDQINAISPTIVDNSVISTFKTGDTTNPKENKYACDNTTDKIFLLSQKEVTSETYGFIAKDNDTNRIRTETDYTKAKGIKGYYDKPNWWWLRSPAPNSENGDATQLIFADGDDFGNRSNNKTGIGVVPALTIEF